MPRILSAVAVGLAVFVAVFVILHERALACDDESRVEWVLGVGCFVPGDGSTSPTPAPFVQPDDDDQDGSPSNCSYEYVWTYDPAAPDADVSINGSGRRQDYYELVRGSSPDCFGYQWVDATDPAAPAITAADLLPGVWVNVQRQLPTPIPRVAPADFDPDGFAYVQNPTFFWVDQVTGQWAPVTGSASGGGITVSVRADPVRLIVSPGDGEEVVCEGAPPPFRQGAGSNPADFPGCEHTYRDSSAMAPNGETFPVTVTVEWSASWSATTGEGGSLGLRSTTSETRWLPVAEIQAIVTAGG